MAGLREREQEQVEREVGVALGPHEGVRLLEDRRGVPSETRRLSGTRGGGERAEPRVGLPQHVRRTGAGCLQQGVRLRGVELDEGAREVVGGDLGVARGLRGTLREGERLGHLGGRLQLHGCGVSCEVRR